MRTPVEWGGWWDSNDQLSRGLLELGACRTHRTRETYQLGPLGDGLATVSFGSCCLLTQKEFHVTAVVADARACGVGRLYRV